MLRMSATMALFLSLIFFMPMLLLLLMQMVLKDPTQMYAEDVMGVLAPAGPLQARVEVDKQMCTLFALLLDLSLGLPRAADCRGLLIFRPGRVR